MARRVGYLESFKKKFRNTPVLHVEVGNFLTDAADYQGRLSAVALLQNEQVIRAFSRWPSHVINLGRPDLLYAERLLTKNGLAARLASYPALKNMISANLRFEGDVSAPPPYSIKRVSSPRIPGRLIRVGFAGLAEPKQVSEGVDARTSDIYAAARRVVPQLRRKSDVLVILAHAELGTALRLARENPEADLVIAGHAEGVFQPRQVGNVLVVCAAPGNMQQGDLRVYLTRGGRFNFKFRAIDLDASVPADADALAYTEAARAEIKRFRD